MLRIANLEAGYESLRVIKGVSLHVSPGEVVAIIGPNGAGKTTLLATIAGLIEPRTGEISLQGRRIEQAPPEPATEAPGGGSSAARVRWTIASAAGADYQTERGVLWMPLFA